MYIFILYYIQIFLRFWMNIQILRIEMSEYGSVFALVGNEQTRVSFSGTEEIFSHFSHITCCLKAFLKNSISEMWICFNYFWIWLLWENINCLFYSLLKYEKRCGVVFRLVGDEQTRVSFAGAGKIYDWYFNSFNIVYLFGFLLFFLHEINFAEVHHCVKILYKKCTYNILKNIFKVFSNPI